MTALALARTNSSYWMTAVSIAGPRKNYDVPSVVTKPSDDVIAKAIDDWLSETSLMSSIDDMMAAPTFETLVGFGRAALPKIIDSLSDAPSLLGLAAAEIVGDDPVTDSIRGDVRAMTGAWIGWYQRAKRDFV